MCAYVHVYSHSISFIIRCWTQWRVGDSGHPASVIHHDQHTEDNTVNTRHWASMKSSNVRGRLSSSPSSSLEYIIRNERISTISSISTGRSLSFNKKHHNSFQSTCFLCDLPWPVLINTLYTRVKPVFCSFLHVSRCFWNQLPRSFRQRLLRSY